MFLHLLDGVLPGSTDSLKRRSWISPSTNTTAETNYENEKSSNIPLANNSSASSSSLSKSYDKLDSLGSSPKINDDISSAFIENETRGNSKIKSQTVKDDVKESSRGLFANKLRKFKKGMNDSLFVIFSNNKIMIADKHAEEHILNERIIIGGENETMKLKKGSTVPREILQMFDGKSREVS